MNFKIVCATLSETCRAVARIIGVIAQLGERYNGIVEVGGSIPPGSTIFVKRLTLIVQYIFSLVLFIPCALGVFCADIFGIDNRELIVYIKMASIFILVVSFMLCWYVSNLIIRRGVLKCAYDFGLSIIDIDFEKISPANLTTTAKKASTQFERYAAYQFELLGYCIPFWAMFLILLVMGIYRNPDAILNYCVGCTIILILVKLAYAIAGTCSVLERNRYLRETLCKLALAAKGVQFYNSKKLIESKLERANGDFINATKKQITSGVWRAFGFICILFLVIIVIYIANQEYIVNHLFNVKEINALYLTDMSLFVLFLVKFLHWTNERDVKFENITKYRLQDKEDELQQKDINAKNLFIAFHGVYFQEPTTSSNSSEIKDLTFSILPGEFIAITGEDAKAMRYIFDLLLRFYKPQSGQIYLAGTKIENINKERLRSLIGIFEEDFGLIDGTIQENLEMASDDFSQISAVAENIGLIECLNMELYCGGHIQLSQEELFRLQIARLALYKPKIVLITTPQSFESTETEKMFYDFVDYSRKNRTVILITNKISTMIYADKILFLKQSYSGFGTHAELSKNADYQRYVRKNDAL